MFIEAEREKIVHLRGTGVGGGTIIGLSKKLLGVTDFNVIMKLAEKGAIKNVDLLIGDIVDTSISFLNCEATASNFAKMLDTATDNDIAMGILNLTYQVIGMLAVFAAQGRNAGKVIITGNGSNNIVGKKILDDVSALYCMKFDYPEDAEFTTAIGAALSS